MNNIDTYNNGGGQVKVGENNSGIYIADTLVAGVKFDIKQLVDNITIANDFIDISDGPNARRILIVNLSDSSETVLYRDDIQTKIPAQHIEWYSYDNVNNQSIAYYNEGNADLRCLLQYIEGGRNLVTSYVDSICSNGDSMFDIYDNKVPITYNIVCIVMNA
jgi:hypothetical protein